MQDADECVYGLLTALYFPVPREIKKETAYGSKFWGLFFKQAIGLNGR